MNNKPIRIPRVQGTTLLAQTQMISETYAHILNHYLSNGFTYLGKRMGTEELCYYTLIPSPEIHKAILDSSGVYSRLFNPEAIQDTARELLGRAFSGTLGDRARILKFAERLEGQLANDQSIGTSLKVGYLYQKTLDSVLRSTQSFSQLLAQIMPKGPQLNIFMGLEENPNKDKASENYMGRAEALELINLNNPNPLLLEGQTSPKAQDLFNRYGLGDITPILASPHDDGEVMMGNLPKVSDILVNELYDNKGNILE